MLEWMLIAGGLGALGWAAVADFRKLEFDVMSLAEMGALGLVFIVCFAPLSFSGHLAFGLMGFLIGCMLFEAKCFTEGDAMVMGMVGWMSLPVDYVLFSSIAITVFAVSVAVHKIRKHVAFPGLPMMLGIYAAYNGVVLCLL